HAALHAANQRQGGAVHPDAAPPLGLSQAVPDLRTTNRRASPLAGRVQSPPAPSSPRHGPADRSPQGSARTTSLETTARLRPPMLAFELAAATKHYGARRPALDAVDLAVPEGTALGLLGP